MEAYTWSRRSAGATAVILCGHQVAADCRDWDIAPSGVWGENDPAGKWSFVAQSDERSQFWLDNANSFTLVATDHSGRVLTWRGVEVVDSDKIGARGIGPPEVRETL